MENGHPRGAICSPYSYYFKQSEVQHLGPRGDLTLVFTNSCSQSQAGAARVSCVPLSAIGFFWRERGFFDLRSPQKIDQCPLTLAFQDH